MDLSDIITGKCDGQLDQIIRSVNARREMLKTAEIAMNMTEIKAGDTVRLKGLKPRYMNGQLATVVEKNRTRLVIRLNNNNGRFGSAPVTVPANCVEIVQVPKE